MGKTKREVLSVEQDGTTLYLYIDRPDALNALNAQVFSELEDELHRATANHETRAIVITGAGGKAFSAGADLDELMGLDSVETRRLLARGQRLFRSVEQLGVPVVAAVNGHALGGGFELALACTLVVGSERATFGLPEVKLGLMPGYGGTQRLARHIGQQAALRLMLTGERIDAPSAHELGLLCQAPVPAEELLEVAGGIAEEVSKGSPGSVRLILEALHSSDSLDPGLAHETTLASLAANSEDAVEGVRAFKEKRTPSFGGRS